MALVVTFASGCQQYEYRGDMQGAASISVGAKVEMVLEFGPDVVGQAV